MGEVYLAYDQRLDRRVAIKHLRPEADDPIGRARLRREARAAAKLNHSAIVQIFELLETEDGDWIVQELVEGTTLAARLADGALDLPDVLAFGEQIASGLAEAHDKGILHRDLKAQNIMVTPTDKVKILDFGLAKPLVKTKDDLSLSGRGQLLGTTYAMSPEQARGLAVDSRSDLFSLGSLLYQMATGVAPFRGASVLETLSRITTQQPTPIGRLDPRLPFELSHLIERLLAKAPELRPASASEVVVTLRRLHFGSHESPAIIESAEATLAAETRIQPRPSNGPWVDRRAIGWVVAGLVVALAAALLSNQPWHRGETKDPDAGISSEVATAAALSAPELYSQGMALLRHFDLPGNLDQARAVFQRMLALDDGSAAAYAGLARAYLYRYQSSNYEPVTLDQALAAANQAVSLDPFLADGRLSRGLIYQRLGRPDDATAELEEALTLDPTLAEAHRGLGELHESRGDFEAAEAAYRAAIEIEPGNRIFHDNLGALYFKTGRYEAAETAFKNSIASAPESIFGHRNLASTYYIQGRLDEASAELQKALRIQPSATLYSSLGTIFFSQGLYEKAAVAYDKALSTGGNNSLYWSNLADAYRQIPDREADARETLERADQLLEEQIASQPHDVTLWSRRALVLAKLGERDRALAELARIDSQEMVDAYTLYRVAVSYEICGQRALALERLEKALGAGFSLSEVRLDPELLELRTDPRFHRLVLKPTSYRRGQPASPDRR